MRSHRFGSWLPALVAVPFLTLGAACGDDDNNQNQNNQNNQNNNNAALTYVGSETCEGCHQDHYDDMMDSAHPYKIVPVTNASAPDYPYSSVPNPPSGYSWGDVTYVIGGYGWKARWIDNDGYIVTGDAVQYNLATQGFSAYHATDAPGTKPYDCGKCHTTGWVATGESGPHQDGLAGIYGTWAEPGVRCEACHGPGSAHAANPSTDNITVDTDSSMCGQCHTRDAQNRIEFKGGFVRHHEQYDEWLVSPHNAANIDCVDCHDPHKGVLYQGSAGLVSECEDCHTNMTVNHNGTPTCIDCHMPHTAKSAVASTAYEGDVKSHMFAIGTTDATWGTKVTEVDGTQFLNGPLTLDRVCYTCHQDENGEGGSGSMKTMQDLSTRAAGIHQ